MMATAAPAAQNDTPFRAKTALFGFIAVMVAYVVWHNESFLVQPQHPVWQHYQPFKWWLLPHGIAGACAILLGPMQFSDRLRRRYTKLHRVLGRIYVGGALIAAPLGAYIQFFEERSGGPRSFSIAATADAVLLMATTGIAFAFILSGNVQKHRQWMTRSFAVALVFVEVRVIGGVTGWDTNPAAIETIVWTCLVFALFVADVVLQLQERRPKPALQARAQSAS
jgi:uncharacterized membrane protein